MSAFNDTPRPACGTLFGIGVGPGEPDLLTLRAAHALSRVRVVFAASSTRNDYSVALDIARPHLPADVRIETLGFPMTRDKAALTAAWEANARAVADTLRKGEDAAFLTLGDPLIYSTFGYLLRTLRRVAPDLPDDAVQVVPGVTSYQAAAARTRTILCEADETLLLVPGVNGTDKLATDVAGADNAVILKAYRKFPEIRRVLHEQGAAEQAVFVSRLGLPGEIIAPALADAPDAPHYLTLLLVPKGRSGDDSGDDSGNETGDDSGKA
ncbi:MAG TPA: precorrin-2 C(20)-methyltransferase [Nitratidesulfovibrio sp.]|nr:precorrin-2 C(20)-methyltransferase [Nitratidesulfovibrio sp.]